MSIGYFVRYEGQSSEPERFVDYYMNTHGSFMKGYPGIRSAIVHLPVEGWHDPLKINPGTSFMLGEFTFDSVDALNAALASEARIRAREDAGRFPHFEGKVTHQAFKKHILF
ncbi:EthD family reductase [Bosea sp. RAF48]|uniref:EthD family reductase n=1 Tax=Bosea sp. RAF48 TaxID=3237480 RepID=UPI003F8E2973